MEDIKQHLAAQIAKCERMAAALDTQAVALQRAIAESRASAGQERAKAAEFRRLLATYGVEPEDVVFPNCPPTPGSEQAQEGPQQAAQGTNGRKVVEVDVPEEESLGGLPDAIWVNNEDLQHGQSRMASAVDDDASKHLIQVAMLTREQKLKYGVQS